MAKGTEVYSFIMNLFKKLDSLCPNFFIPMREKSFVCRKFII